MHALEKCSECRERMLFRGMQFLDAEKFANILSLYVDGREFCWHQVSSCTTKVSVLKTFMGKSGKRLMFNIELTSNRARVISPYSLIPHEEEVLLPPNSRFVVRGILDQGDLRIIQVCEVECKDPILIFTSPSETLLSADLMEQMTRQASLLREQQHILAASQQEAEQLRVQIADLHTIASSVTSAPPTTATTATALSSQSGNQASCQATVFRAISGHVKSKVFAYKECRGWFGGEKIFGGTGIVKWLNEIARGNPHDARLINCHASSVLFGSVSDIVGMEFETSLDTDDRVGSWVCVDLGQGVSCCLTHYALRMCSDWSSFVFAPRGWQLEGSQDHNTWSTIKKHNNCHDIAATSGGQYSWPVNCNDYYRYFRILQCERNAAGNNVLAVGKIEIWGALHANAAASTTLLRKL